MKEEAIMMRLDRIEIDLKEIKGLLLAQAGKGDGNDKPQNQEEILSAKEVARLLQCTIQSVYTKCAQGELPHVKMGKSYKFRKLEILNWIKEQKPNSSFSVEDYVDRYLQKHTLKG
jgi:excisionase family DNA binding protein